MADEHDVERIALSLPETSRREGEFRFFVCDKAFAWSYMERVDPKRPRVRRSDVLAVRVDGEERKDALLATAPGTYFITDHYLGYPAILVRLPVIGTGELEELLTDAWRCRAPRRLVKAFDAASGSGMD